MSLVQLSAADWFQWLGCGFGLAGAFVLALNLSWSGWGFIGFLVSNAFWIAFAVATKSNGLLVMQIGFVVANGIGVWRWRTSFSR